VLPSIACGSKRPGRCQLPGFSSGLAAQVDARANQLAHHLIAQGASLGSAVGLLLEPSTDAIIAMLAVLKAGCCYLPLQQHCSDAALALVAEDASLAVAVAHRGLQRRLPVGHAVRAVALDAPREEAAIRRRPTHSPGRRGAPVDAAYVLFFQAAGATRPSGTVHQHAGLADMLAGMAHLAGTGTGSIADHQPRVALAAPLTEHAAALEVWTPLTQGGVLVIARPDADLDVPYFAGLLAHARITAAHFTAKALESAAQTRALEAAAGSLRCIWVTEPLEPGVAEATFEALPGAMLVLGYGLLEATPFVTAAVLRKGDELVGDPIGRPLTHTRARPRAVKSEHAHLSGPCCVLLILSGCNMACRAAIWHVWLLSGQPMRPIPTCGAQALVLDDLQNPVPVGVPGQLHVSGACLARGYIGLPQLTAEHFVPNPLFDAHADEAQYALMFRTGDLVAWQPDGSLRYVNRVGDEVQHAPCLATCLLHLTRPPACRVCHVPARSGCWAVPLPAGRSDRGSLEWL